MNVYRCSFWDRCPENGDPVHYELEIRSRDFILAEDLSAFVFDERPKNLYQEKIADAIAERFRGALVIVRGWHGEIFIKSRRRFR